MLMTFRSTRSYLFCFLVSSFLLIDSHAYADDSLWESSKRSGYLLIYADLNYENATMRIKPLNSPSDATISIDLGGEGETRWVRRRLTQGWYQVVSIEAPYFNLPYRLTTDEKLSWRFEIRAEATNYFGTLFIDRERTKSDVDIRRYNRFATQLVEIREYIGVNQESYPLRSAFPYRDDFAVELLDN